MQSGRYIEARRLCESSVNPASFELCVWKSLSCVQLFVTLWIIQSMEFSRPEYWSGSPFPSPGDLPNPGIELRSALQLDSLPAEPSQTQLRHLSMHTLSTHSKKSSRSTLSTLLFLSFYGQQPGHDSLHSYVFLLPSQTVTSQAVVLWFSAITSTTTTWHPFSPRISWRLKTGAIFFQSPYVDIFRLLNIINKDQTISYSHNN